MDILMSNWKASEVEANSVPPNYIFPPEQRPGKRTFPFCNDIPIIDLGKINDPGDDHVDGRSIIIQKIMNACQDSGYFQVINHGLPDSLMEEAMRVAKEFFELPAEDKAKFYSTEWNNPCRLYSSSLYYDKEELHYWRDNFSHHCNPLEDNIQNWPDKPVRYREVISEYCTKMRKCLLTVLDLMREGLGLRVGYFDGEISKIQIFSVNYSIPCPDPSLALAQYEHVDPNIITALHQNSVPGLQIFKDGEWHFVKTLPNALFLSPSLQLKVISNGLFKCALHRVVPHKTKIRMSIGSFINPADDSLIEPSEALINAENPPVYRALQYGPFLASYDGKDWAATLEKYKK